MSVTPHLVIAFATLAALGVLWRVLAAAVRSGRYPRIELPPSDLRRGGAGQLCFAGAGLLAAGLGTAAGALLYQVPKVDRSAALFSYSNFDASGLRYVGPLFLALGVVGISIWPIAARSVSAATLHHLLWSQARVAGGADPRPITRWLGLAVGVVAIAAHLAIRVEHTSFDAQGVRWRDFPWQAEQVRPWSEVRDVRIVRQLTAAAGNVVDRPHLGIEFADGTVVHAGMRAYEQPAFWERPARIAGAHAGVPVHRVERD